MTSAGAARIPPIQCLLTFEALARLRSVSQAAEELCVTPSAVSHRVRQLEQLLGTRLFGRADFSLTTEGSEYLAHVREGLAILGRMPGRESPGTRRKLRVAVTPTPDRSTERRPAVPQTQRREPERRPLPRIVSSGGAGQSHRPRNGQADDGVLGHVRAGGGQSLGASRGGTGMPEGGCQHAGHRGAREGPSPRHAPRVARPPRCRRSD